MTVRLALLLALAATASCGKGGDESTAARYGPPVRMAGLFFGGTESQTLRPCPGGRCVPQRSRDEPCWAEVSREAARQWRAAIPGGHMRRGTQRVEIVARPRLGIGGFGHLGSFACAFRVERVTAACPSDWTRRNWNGCGTPAGRARRSPSEEAHATEAL